MTARSFMVTWHAPDEVTEPWDIVPILEEQDVIVRMVWQFELCPTTGRLHLQGYCELNPRSPQRMSRVKAVLGAPTAHLERRLGTAGQAVAYCTKDESRAPGPLAGPLWWPREWSPEKTQGRRTDLDELLKAVQEGQGLRQVAEANPSVFVRYHKGIKAFKDLLFVPKDRGEQEVFVLYGDAGTGKSRYVFENFPEVFPVALGRAGGQLWWDGYDGESTIIIDDFHGEIPLVEFKRILDRHKMRVPVKGGFVPACWNTIFITSNMQPIDWYATPEPQDRQAIARRITGMRKFMCDVDGGRSEVVCVRCHFLGNLRCNCPVVPESPERLSL